jgi:hypothetical protein
MKFETLTIKRIQARPVVLGLERPVVARIATLTDWPLILIDLYTEEGVVGRSYLEPYIPKSMRYLIPAIQEWTSTKDFTLEKHWNDVTLLTISASPGLKNLSFMTISRVTLDLLPI